jgi:glycosyltransferase involved in cell wall biosynthesis
MTRNVDVSVVIGFKDWGTGRLRLAVQTIQKSFGSLAGEVIVSDYGSSDFEDTRRAMEEIGATYVYTPTNGVWSRSRALNAGFAVSSGQVLVSTDADMIFSPKSMEIVGKAILKNPRLALVLQCRDLPEGYSDEELDISSLDWPLLETVSRMRPRWGMGGMMAASRAKFLQIRGLDERMEIYGGEDIDFANRLRRSGARLEWVVDDDVRMYHMWHAPSRAIANETPEGRQAIDLNRKIHVEDKSFVRNTLSWRHRPADEELPVSVVISTYNRGPFIGDSIKSVLAQTMPDFELIIVDDGSTDETRQIVSAFRDERIRYFYRSNAGIAAARNFAASVSRGRYTAVHDDDDIMLPWRLEKHLETLQPDHHGSYGAWADFNNRTGEMFLQAGKNASLGALLSTSRVYLHPTLMVQTDVIRRLGYDESLRSGSDYNLAIRMMRTGVKLNHTGYVHTLRRLHDGQITETDSVVQKTSAVLSSTMARVPMSGAEVREMTKRYSKIPKQDVGSVPDVKEALAAYLPSHLIPRTAVARVEVNQAAPTLNTADFSERCLVEHDWDGNLVSVIGVYRDVRGDSLAALRDAGLSVEVGQQSAIDCPQHILLMAIEAFVSQQRADSTGNDQPILVFVSQKNLDWLLQLVNERSPEARVHKRILSDEASKTRILYVTGLPMDELESLAVHAETRDLSLRSWIDFAGDFADMAAFYSTTMKGELVK